MERLEDFSHGICPYEKRECDYADKCTYAPFFGVRCHREQQGMKRTSMEEKEKAAQEAVIDSVYEDGRYAILLNGRENEGPRRFAPEDVRARRKRKVTGKVRGRGGAGGWVYPT